ncbi:hypothetical protein RSOL_316620 [Rhizoctonia solani AG-3 Rhs1AP]|uniref:F-box-like domain protein n=1 Tax=Rhizoctonia solani AG-3 Rhs1AP TaxID=1086054 RepID=A0A0A1UM19_9AGAM|nr:hypothetical protein RSOL_316620 [Rhizoctonia solani AG-3 Rhs1AP]
MEELLKTSKRLKSCLDEYLGACSVIATSHDLTGERGTPLLNGIEQELQTVAAYETDILNANSILAQKRNSSPALVPINALSPEILEWIFQLAYRSWLFNMDIRLPYPMFPETLTHVCSRWRQVALGSQSLWSRVNVPIFNRSYELLISRGETFASRVAPPVLDVHILTANRDVFTPYLHRKLDQFCASSGAKIRSLQLTNGIKSATYDLYLESLIQASFPHIVPGTLLPFRSRGLLSTPSWVCREHRGHPVHVPVCTSGGFDQAFATTTRRDLTPDPIVMVEECFFLLGKPCILWTC